MAVSLLKKIHRLWLGFVIIATWAAFLPLYLFAIKKHNYRWLNRLRHRQSLAVLFLSCIKLNVIHRHHLLNTQCVYCCNHTSLLDIFVLLAVLKGNVFFLGKIELLKSPVTRIFFTSVDVPVNRQNKLAAIKTVKGINQRIGQGMSMIIFPEGGISNEYPPRLQEFKEGAAAMAQRHNLPVQPLCITNLFKLVFDDGRRFGTKPGTCTVSILPSISTSNVQLLSTEELNQRIYSVMLSAI